MIVSQLGIVVVDRRPIGCFNLRGLGLDSELRVVLILRDDLIDGCVMCDDPTGFWRLGRRKVLDLEWRVVRGRDRIMRSTLERIIEWGHTVMYGVG